MGLEPVDLAAVGEEQQIRVRGGHDDARHVVLVAQLGAGHAASAPTLRAEGVGDDGLDVARLGHHHDEVFVLDQVLDVDVADVEGDLGPPGLAEPLADLAQLVLDDLAQLGRALEDRLELGDRLPQLGQLVLELGATETREPPEGHVEDVVGLDLAELVRARHQSLPRRVAIGRTTDEGDDLVDLVDRLEQALDDVRTVTPS